MRSSRYAKLDIEAYKTLKANPANETVQIDKSLTETVAKVSWQWAQTQATGNAWFKTVYEDQAAFMASIKPSSEFRFATSTR